MEGGGVGKGRLTHLHDKKEINNVQVFKNKQSLSRSYILFMHLIPHRSFHYI